MTFAKDMDGDAPGDMLVRDVLARLGVTRVEWVMPGDEDVAREEALDAIRAWVEGRTVGDGAIVRTPIAVRNAQKPGTLVVDPRQCALFGEVA